ncbi:MAG: M81 family metallopeptidase [Lautropia sp.]
MRIVTAVMRHETNTFSPIPTPLTAFSRGSVREGPLYGAEAVAAYTGTNSPVAAFIDLAKQEGAELSMPIAASAVPSGVVTREAFEAIADAIVADVRRGCDAAMLDLHGAMVAEGYSDAEGELLRRVRSVAPGLPIAVALDFHANLGVEIARNCTTLAGYRTYPHVDLYDTGMRAGRALLRVLHGEVDPVILWRTLPMLTHMLCQAPARQPMKDIMDRSIAAENAGDVLNASVFGGFPLADVPHVGFGIFLVADRSRRSQGHALLTELGDLAWERRSQFVFPAEPMETSIAHAKTLSDGPIILVDHGDNAGAGGPSDNMASLREVLRQGLRDMVAGPIWDPAAVAEMVAAGEGAEISFELGGKVDTPALRLKGDPLHVTGKVVKITDGNYTVTGPMFTGMRLSLGRTAILETAGVRIFVCERIQEPFDVGVFTHAGVDLTRTRYILIKSRQHFRAGFEPIAKHIVLVAAPGVCSSDYSMFPFQTIPRPIYPLDPEMSENDAHPVEWLDADIG